MPTNPPATATTPATLDYDGLRALLDAPQPRVIDDWAEFVLPHNGEQCGPKLISWGKDFWRARTPFVADLLDVERKHPAPLPEPAPGDYCEDAVEVAPGVWVWRGLFSHVGWHSRAAGDARNLPVF